MIKVNCDRCGAEIDPNGMIGYISWCFKQGVDGDLEMNELEGKHFCERCMDEIMAMIQRHVNWGTLEEKHDVPVIVPVIEEVKKPRKRRSDIEGETAEKIIKLYKQGMNSRQIARELKMDGRKVENWIYYKKNHGGI